VSYSHNVGDKCGTTDKSVQPATSTAGTPSRIGWVDPARYNFELKAGSPAINAANPRDSVPVDQDGQKRGSAPDAGALER
jgi:hypothetical protein